MRPGRARRATDDRRHLKHGGVRSGFSPRRRSFHPPAVPREPLRVHRRSWVTVSERNKPWADWARRRRPIEGQTIWYYRRSEPCQERYRLSRGAVPGAGSQYHQSQLQGQASRNRQHGLLTQRRHGPLTQMLKRTIQLPGGSRGAGVRRIV